MTDATLRPSLAPVKDPVLEVSRLRVVRGRTVILRDVSWRVGPGENWVILGANGSGKTSLLKALTGFLSPTAGGFTVLGRSYGASDWRELRLKLGVVTSAFEFDFHAAYTDTSISYEGCAYTNYCSDRLFFSVTKSF